MCGRFYIENDIEEIIAAYNVKEVKNKSDAKGEIFPGTNIPVILKDSYRTLDFFRWGFKVHGISREVINARIETVAEKPTFRKAFTKNRCIIPANAFFEWETTERGKIKYKISEKNNFVFSMAGIYNQFIDKSNNSYFGVVILTRPANEEMSKLHHRMPVFIKKDEEEIWLSKDFQNLSELQDNLQHDDWMRLSLVAQEGTKQISMYDLI